MKAYFKSKEKILEDLKNKRKNFTISKIPNHFKKDKDFIKNLMAIDPSETLKWAPEQLKNDKEFIKDLIAINPIETLKWAPEYKNDKDLICKKFENKQWLQYQMEYKYGKNFCSNFLQVAGENVQQDEEFIQSLFTDCYNKWLDGYMVDNYKGVDNGYGVYMNDIIQLYMYLNTIYNGKPDISKLELSEDDLEYFNSFSWRREFDKECHRIEVLKRGDELHSAKSESFSPYRMAVKQALMKWYKLPEEEANKQAYYESIGYLEKQVGAMGSVKSAANSLANSLNLPKKEIGHFYNTIIHDSMGDDGYYKYYRNLVKKNNMDANQLALDALAAIHDNWVKDNASEQAFNKKVDKEQLRQYAPLELIGWNEVESDLLFLNPIFEALNIKLDTKELEQAYHKKVEQFIKENGNDFEAMIAKGKDFYPALTEELAEKLKPLSSTVAEQIKTNMQENDPESFEISQKKDLNEIGQELDMINNVVNSLETNNDKKEQVATDTIDTSKLSYEEIQKLEKAGLLQTENNENQISSGKQM